MTKEISMPRFVFFSYETSSLNAAIYMLNNVQLLTKLFTNKEALLLTKMTHRHLTASAEGLLNQQSIARSGSSHDDELSD